MKNKTVEFFIAWGVMAAAFTGVLLLAKTIGFVAFIVVSISFVFAVGVVTILRI